MKPLKTQHAELKKLFPKIAPLPEELPEGDSLYVIPHWSTVAKTYPDAVKLVLHEIDKSRPFYNWREGQIDSEHLRESENKGTPTDNISILNCQLGQKYNGRSVKSVRKEKGEILLGAYEVGIILLTHPETISKYDDLFIDCPGDEFKPDDGREFSYAPLFYFYDGRLKFGADGVGRAYDDCGSASASLPQLRIENRDIDSFESLTLRVKRLEDVLSHYKLTETD